MVAKVLAGLGLLFALLFQTCAAQQIYPEDGWWWNANASGRGYMLERQGQSIFMTSFHYTGIGDPEWLSIQGTYIPSTATTGNIGQLDGMVYRSVGGQRIGGSYMPAVTSLSVQNPLSLTFQSNQKATLTWANETVQLTRFLWNYSDSLSQLSGTWLLTTIKANASPTTATVSIANVGNTATITNSSGALVGSVTLQNGALSLSSVDLSAALPLSVPETKRFYAGNRTANSDVVVGLRINDLPIVAGATQTNGSTAGILCSYNDTTPNAQASVTITSTSRWTCSATARSLVANGIPDHAVGTFPNVNNPNTISAQNVSANYSLLPIQTSTATALGGPRGVLGYVLNGIKIDAGTAGTCNDSGSSCSLAGNVGRWSIEALGQSSFNFGDDANHAHVQPNGEYHYHGIPEGFVTKRGGNSSNMTLIAWAADGFPIYARYGYSVANSASSAIRVINSSYRLVSTPGAGRPATSTYPLGTFTQDWQYVAGSGDLDECNGRVGVTPEFPNGIYHYYATDSYPYFQRCVKGSL